MSVDATPLSRYDTLVAAAASAKLSVLLPTFIELARETGAHDQETWARLEFNGYYNTNPALTEETVVPEYRTVSGQHLDRMHRPITVPDSRLAFINEYRLRFSVPELEAMETQSGLITISDPHTTEILRKSLGVDTYGYSFSPVMITGILSSVRTTLSDHLYAMRSMLPDRSLHAGPVASDSGIDIQGFHPSIRTVAASLFSDGYYRQAVLDTYISLVQAVKAKSGRHDLDGVTLMQTVFSPKAPILCVSQDPDEQMGYMWMFTGAVMGVRNPKAHRIIPHDDRQSALEWLAFASVLHRILDSASLQSDQVEEK